MRIIDRLISYLQEKKIKPYSFELNCKVGNGYLKKQERGKGSIGSDILERIHQNYPDLNIAWLVTGEGSMLLTVDPIGQNRPILEEDPQPYGKKETIQLLQQRIALLESALADKEKIIRLLEDKLREREG